MVHVDGKEIKISPSSGFKEAKQSLSESNLKETRERLAEKANAAPPLPSIVTGQIREKPFFLKLLVT